MLRRSLAAFTLLIGILIGSFVAPAPPALAAASLVVWDLNTFTQVADPMSLSTGISYSVVYTPASAADKLEIDLSTTAANWSVSSWGYGGSGGSCSFVATDHYVCNAPSSTLTSISLTAVPAAAIGAAMSGRSRNPANTTIRGYSAS